MNWLFGVKPEVFTAVASISLPEIMGELILDALKESDDWEEQLSCFTDKDDAFPSYHKQGIEIAVHDNRIDFAGLYAWKIDDDIDLMADADIVMSIIDWISGGSRCPILKHGNALKQKARKMEDDRQPSSWNSKKLKPWQGALLDKVTIAEYMEALDDYEAILNSEEEGINNG